MVVRQQMSQHERVAKRGLASVLVRPVSANNGLEDLDSVRQRIQAGKAFLEVVEYPWGVEFDVSEVESQQ
jgi:hypothetical protein